MEEFAWYLVFVGRPNAGKSSLICKLTSAKPVIGKKPGSTRRINSYKITKKFEVIDVPGWGKIHDRTKTYEDRIKDEIVEFFEKFKFRIPACILVIDAKSIIDVSKRLSKKGIIPIDQELYNFMKSNGLIPIVAINKIDKVAKHEEDEAVDYFKKLIDYDNLPEKYQETVITVSAKQGTNLGILRDLIRKHLRDNDVEEFERYIKLR
ncbi:MAG: GTP-binding protein EngB [Candidatus Heimdallarchaeota archaeon]|nr:GTP-binding protein EngB [Candidatus Heimdallarchaeota archaeon]MCK5184337.1 GTP-binding protein EngB [Candidatus Heimdallarchaeota archaeon]MCK5298340.1 GTP-binding protein EngB [Candidatus Heimdallarchaeota archaeon]